MTKKKADNLLFATINSLPSINKQQISKEILELRGRLSFWDDYRHTEMIPLMTKGGTGKTGALNNQPGEFEWLDHSPPMLVEWFENHVFPWIGMKARVMALITQPGVANNEHIDCAPSELNTLQHKFRIVLQGNTNTLYWMTDKGNVPAPDVDGPFIMDGGWPHGMINTSDQPKVTIALGAPWLGNESYGDDITIIQDRTLFTMPNEIDHLWKK
jgi:hypothetical protein